MIKCRTICSAFVKALLSEDQNYEKVLTSLSNANLGLINSNIDENEIHSFIACAYFIFWQSNRNSISSEILQKELIDLGLPKGSFID